MDFMARALQLASRALGTCSPNPAVGAVLVRDGVVVGEGVTQPPGQAHAEIVALQAAGASARGASLYVTLEPCAHFGRTGPCADALIEAGIADVHVATLDPSPWVNGRGVAALERAGIHVRVGAHGREARRLNEAYLTWVLQRRPLVTAVYAIGLDGRSGELSAPTLGGPASAELERLRFRADRTVTTVATVLEDPGPARLASDGITAVNVEATSAAALALAQHGLLDRLVVFVVPSLGTGLLPGDQPNVALSIPGPMLSLQSIVYERLGETLLVTADLAKPDAPSVSKPVTTESTSTHAAQPNPS
jgi:pyrimidine deaminase RibD-like protein